MSIPDPENAATDPEQDPNIERAPRGGAPSFSGHDEAARETVVPVINEELHAGVQKVKTGGVRVTKTVHERQEVLDQPLLEEEVEVRRVIVDKRIDRIPEIRQVGDTTIVPVVKEVLKVEKQLVLAEELHIKKRRTQTRSRQTVNLRSEQADVERIDAEGNAIAAERPAASAPVEQKPPSRAPYRARIPHPLRKPGPRGRE
jgi:uncharacterized protein (TIGR02271 family)